MKPPINKELANNYKIRAEKAEQEAKKNKKRKDIKETKRVKGNFKFIK
jgi:hypothetical protein